jgi:glutamyl-tRNA reductase
MVADDPAAEARPLTEVQAEPPRTGLVAAVTSSEEPILHVGQVSAIRDQLPKDESLLLVDLAMPPNVDPAVRELEGVLVHGIDEMRDEAERNRQLRLAEMNRCEGLVEHQLETLRKHLLDRELSPVARGLQQSFGEVADRSLRHALGKDLSHLEDDDRAALEKMVRDMSKRMVQVPLRGLKTAARNHSSAVIANFLRGLDGNDGNGSGESR